VFLAEYPDEAEWYADNEKARFIGDGKRPQVHRFRAAPGRVRDIDAEIRRRLGDRYMGFLGSKVRKAT
jgi:hypothetical protein